MNYVWSNDFSVFCRIWCRSSHTKSQNRWALGVQFSFHRFENQIHWQYIKTILGNILHRTVLVSVPWVLVCHLSKFPEFKKLLFIFLIINDNNNWSNGWISISIVFIAFKMYKHLICSHLIRLNSFHSVLHCLDTRFELNLLNLLNCSPFTYRSFLTEYIRLS